MSKIYGIYKGRSGIPLCIGTKEECSEFLGITIPSLYCEITRKENRKNLYITYLFEEKDDSNG